jgi:hypothetical protein
MSCCQASECDEMTAPFGTDLRLHPKLQTQSCLRAYQNLTTDWLKQFSLAVNCADARRWGPAKLPDIDQPAAWHSSGRWWLHQGDELPWRRAPRDARSRWVARDVMLRGKVAAIYTWFILIVVVSASDTSSAAADFPAGLRVGQRRVAVTAWSAGTRPRTEACREDSVETGTATSVTASTPSCSFVPFLSFRRVRNEKSQILVMQVCLSAYNNSRNVTWKVMSEQFHWNLSKCFSIFVKIGRQ